MRKRKKLEVSTFPFLAVLLCTMGALILLLLIMDKKAKKASLEQAYEAAWAQSKNLQAKTDIEKQNLESEKSAWIKLKSEQHEELLKKEATLEKEIALLKIELSQLDKNHKKSKSETPSEDLLKKEIALTNEKSKLHMLAIKLELEKANADKNLKETKDLTEKIVLMELILKEMKFSIDKDKFAFSIVPYFGKNGLNRKPLYIECNESGILFFPDKTLIPSNDESDNLKNEILNRTSLLREYLQQTLGPNESTPYLMLLVRPGGITNYWKLQSIIKPLDIDFGYELVDKIWVLDIPTEQSAPSPSKLVSMIKPMKIPKPIPAPGNILGGINNGNSNIPQQNKASTNNGINQNGNEKRNGSTGNTKSISYGATAQNIRPITSLPGFPVIKNSTNTLVKNNPTLLNNQNGNGADNNNLNSSGSGNSNQNGNGAGNNNTNSPGSGNSNQNGNGADNNNLNSSGSGNSNQNGNGAGNNNTNSPGSGNSNQNGNGTGNINPNSPGSGNSNKNGNGAGNINTNSPGSGNSNQNGNGTGNINPNMTSNSNDKNENQTNRNNQTIGNPNKSTTDLNQNHNNQNDPAGATNGNTKSINKGSDSSGNGNTSNSANNGAGGVSGTKGPYSVATTPNSYSDGNSNDKKGTGAESSGEEKKQSNIDNSDGSPGQKGNEPNSTTKKESSKSANGSNGQDSQPTSQDQNPSISISLNSKKNDPNVTNKQSPPRTTYNREDESQSNSDAQDPTARIAAPLPELGPRKSSTPAPLRAARLFADRDWIIYVECKFEEILVHPNRLVIPTSLLASEEGVKRFMQEIEKMITRKQSTVRVGEPPYRPEVRFLVWPDGLKPYHLSYPALQLAGIKQKRQNLDSEDSIKEIIQGR